ncbi:protein of unknown function [Methylorubrum extorquens]|uniref:Uncharacterized protein n=1 Tax=Methylorubrum extorquens TaxID=408 RepID=A0A2N9ASG9_METEX|nr:protein of unknown function [Methylorubrum extorquens]
MRPSPARGAWTEIADMEGDVKDIERIGAVLSHMASSDVVVEGAELHLMADLLRERGRKLAAQWEAALKVAAECEGRSCA